MIHFIEMSGVDAEAALQTLAAACHAAGERAELLVSEDRPGLYLLMCWGDGPPDLPETDLRHWKFRPVAHPDAP
jgi:hypothetical protein